MLEKISSQIDGLAKAWLKLTATEKAALIQLCVDSYRSLQATIASEPAVKIRRLRPRTRPSGPPR